MHTPTRAFAIATDGGETIRGPAGGPATITARTEATAGSFTFLEVEIAPGRGPPEHEPEVARSVAERTLPLC